MPSSLTTKGYKGRFAPSPSGPLHTGSLVAAVASYLDAKANNGLWLVRIEDLDPPRETPQAAADILFTLEKLGLHWDNEVLYQSNQLPLYEQAISSLTKRDLIFPCTCSRKQIQANSGRYPGTCRTQPSQTSKYRAPPLFALRCLVQGSPKSLPIHFTDIFQGPQEQDLDSHGDFIVKRKDGFCAYQLAVVVDDAQQNISHVIRGMDLLESTGRQIYLQSQLNLHTPHYGHIPIIVNSHGQKLSKQHFAKAINIKSPVKAVIQALDYLQQEPDPELNNCHLNDVLAWAIEHWSPNKLKAIQSLQQI